jgi:hypothetical protein
MHAAERERLVAGCGHAVMRSPASAAACTRCRDIWVRTPTNFPGWFDVENVASFSASLEHCGGFEIW